MNHAKHVTTTTDDAFEGAMRLTGLLLVSRMNEKVVVICKTFEETRLQKGLRPMYMKMVVDHEPFERTKLLKGLLLVYHENIISETWCYAHMLRVVAIFSMTCFGLGIIARNPSEHF